VCRESAAHRFTRTARHTSASSVVSPSTNAPSAVGRAHLKLLEIKGEEFHEVAVVHPCSHDPQREVLISPGDPRALEQIREALVEHQRSLLWFRIGAEFRQVPPGERRANERLATASYLYNGGRRAVERPPVVPMLSAPPARSGAAGGM